MSRSCPVSSGGGGKDRLCRTELPGGALATPNGMESSHSPFTSCLTGPFKLYMLVLELKNQPRESTPPTLPALPNNHPLLTSRVTSFSPQKMDSISATISQPLLRPQGRRQRPRSSSFVRHFRSPPLRVRVQFRRPHLRHTSPLFPDPRHHGARRPRRQPLFLPHCGGTAQ